MQKTNTFVLLLATSMLLSCDGYKTKISEQISADESDSLISHVESLIWSLPEVKETQRRSDSLTLGINTLKVASKPNAKCDSISMLVYEDNGESMSTIFRFLYTKDQIWYYDVFNDQHLSLENWRKSRQSLEGEISH